MSTLKNLKNSFADYLKDESGQTSTEYILLLAVAAAIVFKFKDLALTKIEDIISKVFNNPKIDDLLK